MYLPPIHEGFQGIRELGSSGSALKAVRTFRRRCVSSAKGASVLRTQVDRQRHLNGAHSLQGRLIHTHPGNNSFEACVGQPLMRRNPETLQINIGLTCNMACTHCHVESSPSRTETMSLEVADRILELLKRSYNIHTVDITGGAPEMHQAFRYLVRRIRAEATHVRTILDRCNLTILQHPNQSDLIWFLREHGVHIVASLPCYLEENVDTQRGNTAYRRSVAALQQLNGVGYGLPHSHLRLDLVYNPLGPYLPPNQLDLEVQYHDYLFHKFGIRFHRLICITNMPIKRFLQDLQEAGQYDAYMDLLVNAFNPATLDGLMCLDQVHVSYDGSLYDCDFNYALELPVMQRPDRKPGLRTVFDLEHSFEEMSGYQIRTGKHCFGCTAGSGSSCGGAIL